MPQYEYKVVPAPARGERARGVKGAEARFALALETLMNKMGAEGWEYQRAEMLPSEEREGLTRTTTQWRNMLVFRRPRSGSVEAFSPRLLEPPRPNGADTSPGSGAIRMLKDNGVEEPSDVAGMTQALRARAAQKKVDASDTEAAKAEPGAPAAAPTNDTPRPTSSSDASAS